MPSRRVELFQDPGGKKQKAVGQLSETSGSRALFLIPNTLENDLMSRFPDQGLTVMRPVICVGWKLQKNAYSPGSSNVNSNVSPGARPPLSNTSSTDVQV